MTGERSQAGRAGDTPDPGGRSRRVVFLGVALLGVGGVIAAAGGTLLSACGGDSGAQANDGGLDGTFDNSGPTILNVGIGSGPLVLHPGMLTAVAVTVSSPNVELPSSGYSGPVTLTVSGIAGLTATPDAPLVASLSDTTPGQPVKFTVPVGTPLGPARVTLTATAMGGTPQGMATIPALVAGPTGTLDTSFGTMGVFQAPGAGQPAVSHGIAAVEQLDMDGNVVGDAYFFVAAANPGASTIAAVDGTGKPLATFGTNGVLQVPLSVAELVSDAADGRLLAVGTAGGTAVVYGFDAAGQSASTTGFTTPVTLPAMVEGLGATTAQGATYVVGTATTSGQTAMAIAKLDGTGALDGAFGTNGTAVLAIPGATATAVFDAIDALYVAGTSSGQAVVVKLDPDNGAQDMTFGTSGVLTLDAAGHSSAMPYAAVGAGDKLVLLGHAGGDPSPTAFAWGLDITPPDTSSDNADDSGAPPPPPPAATPPWKVALPFGASPLAFAVAGTTNFAGNLFIAGDGPKADPNTLYPWIVGLTSTGVVDPAVFPMTSIDAIAGGVASGVAVDVYGRIVVSGLVTAPSASAGDAGDAGAVTLPATSAGFIARLWP